MRLISSILLCLILLTNLELLGNVHQDKVEVLCGGTQIDSGSTMSIRIDDYSCLTGGGTSCDYQVNSTKIYTELSFNDELSTIYSYNWKVDLVYQIDLYNQAGVKVQSLSSQNLSITYNTEGKYKDIDYTLFEPGTGVKYYKSEVTVTSLTYTNTITNTVLTSSSLENDICFKVYLESDLIYDGSSDPRPHIRIDTTTAYNSSKNELKIIWDYVPGAEYELEILPIDIGNSDLSSTSTTFDYNFKDAIRIHTNRTFYDLSMVFPSSLLMFRVRAVFYLEDNLGNKKRIEGEFSASEIGTITGDQFAYRQNSKNTSLSSWINAYKWTSSVNPLAEMSWRYSVGYAEDGKSSQGITFYDDLLYPTQSVSVSNTNEVALVQTTARDFIGRSAVSIMPSPVLDSGIRYYSNISNNTSGDRFNYLNFDLTSNDTNPEPIDKTTSKGSANYYSSQRTLTGGINSDYIPDGKGYTYARTIYSKDGTNRVVKQSGVGETHKIGSGHETRYYYSTPGQQELDRLFGNNAGLVKNYKKNMVVDANGQASVSYLDGSGRVVATALLDSSFNGNLNIDTKPEDSDFPELTYFLNENNDEYDETKVISTKVILNQSVGEVNFTYEVDSSLYTNCIDGNCEYQLNIYIYDLENEVKVPLNIINSSGIDSISSSTNEITAILQANSLSSISFKANLSIGTYQIVKEIKIPQIKLQEMYNQYIISNDPEKSVQECYNFCAPTISSCDNCKSNCELNYIELKDTMILGVQTQIKAYFNDSGKSVCYRVYDRNTCSFGNNLYYYLGYSISDYMLIEGKIGECENECEEVENLSACENTFEELKSDMSPGGQYFDNHTNDTTQTVNTWLIQHIGSVPTQSFINGYIKQGQIPSGLTITWDVIRAYWDSEWAEGLVQEHPEYCAFTQYCCVSVEQDNESASFLNYNGWSSSSTIYTVNDWQFTNSNEGCYPGDISDSMMYALNNFLPKNPVSSGYYSLLQVADSNQIPTTHPKYNYFHGPTGLVTRMTSSGFIDYFTNVLTQKSKYDLALANCNANGNIFPLQGVLGNLRTTSDGYFIHYPFVDWYMDTTAFKKDLCEQSCSFEIERWLQEFKCQTAITSGRDLDTLKAILIAFCKSTSCGVSTNLTFTLSQQSHSVTHVATSFSQILSVFRNAYGLDNSLCPTPDMERDTLRETKECGCDMVLSAAQIREGLYRHELPVNYSGLSSPDWGGELNASTGEASSYNISTAYNGCVSDINYLYNNSVSLPEDFDCISLVDSLELEDSCETYIAEQNKLLSNIAIEKYNKFIEKKQMNG